LVLLTRKGHELGRYQVDERRPIARAQRNAK
jgi:hypothetical protein